MLNISPGAQISDLADIEDSTKGTVISIADGVTIDSFVKIKPAGGDVDIGAHTTINSAAGLLGRNEDHLHGGRNAQRTDLGHQLAVIKSTNRSRTRAGFSTESAESGHFHW